MRSKIISVLMLVLIAFCAKAQDPSVGGINPDKSPIMIGETTIVSADVLNNSSNAILKANNATWTINLPRFVTVESVVMDNPATSSFLSIYIGAYDPIDGTIIKIISDKGDFPGTGNGGAYLALITVKGAVITTTPGVLTINAVTAPAVGTNNSGNDNADTKIQVIAALPVNLISFNAQKEGTIANLTWSTTQETNSDRFDVERSQNGKNWTNIGAVKSTGESNALKNYSFVDKTPVHGENLYRLKMIDKDMTFAYSRMVSVKFDGLVPNGAELVSVYPNPASDLIFLKEIDLKNIEKVAIVDLMGRTVYSSKSVGVEGINISNLSSGMYLLHVTAVDGVVSNRKIVVRK